MSSTPTDSELVTFNFIRTNYEHKYKQNVPMALKYLTLRFSNRVIGCKLLTIKQDLDFFKLLLTKLPSVRRFNFLFRASDHKYSAKKFHEICDNKPGMIVIIKSNWDNIFGGYTSKSWKVTDKKWGNYVTDKNAFLFLIKSDKTSLQIKCPLLLELKKNRVDDAIFCYNKYGPAFGRGCDIRIGDDCNKPIETGDDSQNPNYSRQFSYNNTSYPIINLCGGNITARSSIPNEYIFQVIDYEVFQIV